MKAEIQKRYSEWEICPTEIFMGRPVDLTLEEQLFSRVNKNSGRILLSMGDGYHGVHIELPMDYMTLSDEEILEKEAALIKAASKKLLPEDVYKRQEEMRTTIVFCQCRRYSVRLLPISMENMRAQSLKADIMITP